MVPARPGWERVPPHAKTLLDKPAMAPGECLPGLMWGAATTKAVRPYLTLGGL